MKLEGLMIWVADVPATVAFYEAAFGLGYLRDLNGCLVELSSPSGW